MIFNKITFTTEDFVLTMTPTKFYNTLSNDGSKLRVYVRYNIELIIDGDQINTVVHYYLSDGHTNTLRANILYPFLYFDIKYDLMNSGIIVLGSTFEGYQSDELVIKLETVVNLDLSVLEKTPSTYLREYMNDETIHRRAHPNARTPTQSTNLIVPDIDKPKKYIKYEHGTFTILSRLDNIVDALLAIKCPEVVNFDYEVAVKDNNYLRYRPRDNPGEFETYNMSSYTRPTGDSSIDSRFDFSFNFDDFMRLKKLQELQDLGRSIENFGRLDVQVIDLPLNITTYENFNREIGIIYEGIAASPPQSTLSDEFKTRVQNYNNLSRKVATRLYMKRADFILEPAKMKEYELIDYLRRGWYIQHAYKKYLKYKAKYLKLKQSMKLS